MIGYLASALAVIGLLASSGACGGTCAEGSVASAPVTAPAPCHESEPESPQSAPDAPCHHDCSGCLVSATLDEGVPSASAVVSRLAVVPLLPRLVASRPPVPWATGPRFADRSPPRSRLSVTSSLRL